MRILITGGGGREHALAVKLAENSRVERKRTTEIFLWIKQYVKIYIIFRKSYMS